jgi:hypothetical protein
MVQTACGAVFCFTIAALPGCSGCWYQASMPATVNRAGGDDPCGARDDGHPHIPPRYNDFTPPSRGESYADPQYGCPVLRLTDAKRQFKLAVHHQYSTISAVNQNGTRIMVITEWGQGAIVDTTGNLVVGTNDFPAINTGNVPWSRASADTFYYARGNSLFAGFVSGHAVKSTKLRTFDGEASVIIPDEEDLSEDGDHLWVVAGRRMFLYTISTGSVGPAMAVGLKDSACGWHKIQIMPSNRGLVTWSCNGAATGQGQEIYNTDGTLYWHMFDNSIHTDVGRDLSGNEIAIVARIPDTYKDACPSGGGIDIIRTAPLHVVSCLVDVNWASAHVSYRDSSAGWVAISFFDPAPCPHYSCFAPQNLAPDWASDWRHYYEEVILVKVDGSVVFRLAHHRSRSAESYWAESRAAISRDGRYLVFDSNMDMGDTGLNSYSDVYLIKLR